jgi:S-adenosylmethionine/arginine decarboxylase-like enzyme
VLRSALVQACARHGQEAPAHLHRFQPQGASLWVGGPRFHLTLHTWPERGLATLDVLGPQEGTAALVETLLLALGMAVVQRSDSARGGG